MSGQHLLNPIAFSQLSLVLVDPVPGAVCLSYMAQSDMLDHNPGRARVFDAVFLAFSNDACSSPCGVLSHLLPFCHVAVVGRDRVAVSQLHFQLKNCTLARHAFRVVHGFLKSGGDIQSSAKHSARIASRPCDVEPNLLDVQSCLQRRPTSTRADRTSTDLRPSVHRTGSSTFASGRTI